VRGKLWEVELRIVGYLVEINRQELQDEVGESVCFVIILVGLFGMPVAGVHGDVGVRSVDQCKLNLLAEFL